MKYLTVTQTAKLLKVSRSAILHKIKRNKNKPFSGAIKPGHDWLIPYHKVLNQKKFIKK